MGILELGSEALRAGEEGSKEGDSEGELDDEDVAVSGESGVVCKRLSTDEEE